MDRLLAPFAPQMLSILRIATALTFLSHGTQKLLGFPAGRGAPEFLSLYWFAGMLELVGGALLIIGLFTRPVAFILSGMMAVAFFMGHVAPSGSLIPIVNRGEAAYLFCFVFLYIACAGPGPWSLDARREGTATVR
ncbi:MAG TPA: DoxX family protein [Acetobacteraceae bacterium]|nr:DoxX family protein [Acetobacteraceae bacterium]